jgi:ATP-dependent Clp protease ATP-binding subunit ClpA
MVVTFNPLSRGTILVITEKELREISEREGLSAKKIRLSWTRQLVEYLAEQGFDYKYGARQLQRAIERLLVTPLARYLVTHPVLKDVTIRANLGKGNNVIFDTVA